MFKNYLIAVVLLTLSSVALADAGPSQIWRMEITSGEESIIEVAEIELLDNQGTNLTDLYRTYNFEEAAPAGSTTWAINHSLNIQTKMSNVDTYAYAVDVIAPGDYFYVAADDELSIRAAAGYNVVSFTGMTTDPTIYVAAIAGYGDVNVGTKTGNDDTGLSENTLYTFDITVDSGTIQNVSVTTPTTGTGVTYNDLIGAIPTLTGATVDMSGSGTLRFTSDSTGSTSTIALVDGTLFAALTDFASISATAGVDEVTANPSSPATDDIVRNTTSGDFFQYDGAVWNALAVSTVTTLPEPELIEPTLITFDDADNATVTFGVATVGVATVMGSSFDTPSINRPGSAIPPSTLISNRASAVVFDNNKSSYFKSSRAPTERNPLAIQYTYWLGDPTRYPTIDSYSITIRASNTAPKSWKLMYWDDGQWKLADQQAGIKFKDGETRNFNIGFF